MQSNRTAILVRCTQEEAERIRHAAAHERRTVSAYVVKAVMNRIENRERALAAFEQMQQKLRDPR